ncbi:hypothetical protein EYC84_004589 [Monilinia fructicola]|uniref:Uncharacterized protein n=1 Tax=Monilinia fructicola TaxID=38448 RepID=A0A5M9K3T1_MONFR|nr:hypothetical protein EYC84_004589 [Monilinia fructicola]
MDTEGGCLYYCYSHEYHYLAYLPNIYPTRRLTNTYLNQTTFTINIIKQDIYYNSLRPIINKPNHKLFQILNSTQLNSTQPNSTQLNSTQYNIRNTLVKMSDDTTTAPETDSQITFKVKTSSDGNHTITMPETASVLDLKTNWQYDSHG